MVTFHTKGHPTFVSDATTKDVLETIAVLRDSPLESTANLGEALSLDDISLLFFYKIISTAEKNQGKFYSKRLNAGKFELSMICFGVNLPRFGYVFKNHSQVLWYFISFCIPYTNNAVDAGVRF